MKDALISSDDIRSLHPVFQGKYGDKLIELGIKISALYVPNEIYSRSKHLRGAAFCKDVLDKLEIKRIIRNAEVLKDVKGNPFITVSNHPYGHIDGIAVIEALASRTDNYKIMVNHILGLIDTMSDNFITVNPLINEEKNKVTFAGIRESIAHIKENKSMGFFPAGAVSNLYFKNGRFIIEDREWQPAVLKIIQKAGIPVIPIHVSGHNSISFYFSRIFGWKFRNLRLCHELYNKKGKDIVLTFGEPIMPETIKQFNSGTQQLGDFLKRTTYALGKKQ
jgi:putative hemolysin